MLVRLASPDSDGGEGHRLGPGGIGPRPSFHHSFRSDLAEGRRRILGCEWELELEPEYQPPMHRVRGLYPHVLALVDQVD